MKNVIRVAALVLSAAAFVGCDDKSNTTVTTPDGKTTTVSTPTVPSMDDAKKSTEKTGDKMGDAIKTGTEKVESAAKDGMNKLNEKVQGMGATTKPAMPEMPAMPK